MTVFSTKSEDITIGTNNFIVNRVANQEYQTVGVFDEEFYSVNKSAIRNNFSEQEAINLIDRIRNELPMNQ